MPIAIFRLLALLMALVSSAPQVGAAMSQSPDEVNALLEEIRIRATAPKNGPFDKLARMESEEALKALFRSLGLVGADAAYPMLFSAVSAYANVDELREEALRFTIKHAGSNSPAIAGAAVRNLAAFGEGGRDVLWQVARAGRNAIGRAYAIGALRAELAQATGPEVLKIVLNGIRVPESGRRGQVERLLRTFDTGPALEAMSRYVADPRASEQRQLLILSALDTHPEGKNPAVDAGIEAVLASAIESKSSALQFRGLTMATARGSSVDATLLESLARSGDASIRRAAFEAGMVGPGAPFDLRELAQSHDPIARQAAASELTRHGSSRSPRTVALVHALLGDKDRVVRLEAILAVEAIRAKASIPLLIQMLSAEVGRLRGDVLRALKGLTGRDYGLRGSAWASFWESEGDAFRVPSAKAVQKAELEALQRKRQGSQSGFYGLQILSHRFTLVVDTSGSMLEPAYTGATRIIVAKRELMKALKSLTEGTLFNIISFNVVARPMAHRLEKVSKRTIAKAAKYVKGLRADGGTNVYDALQAAFNDPEIDTIYLVTDGDPTVGRIVDVGALRAEIARWNYARRVAIHCVAVGQNHELLRGLAKDHGGTYVVVY